MSALHDFIHACQGRVVTRGSATRGLFAGAGVGGILTGLGWMVAPILLNPPAPADWGGVNPILGAAMLVYLVLLVAACAAPFWMLGLGASAPAWWLLHRLGLRCWSAAMLLGAVLAPAPILIVVRDWTAAGAFSLCGAIVGLTVWLVAYRKPAEGAVC